MAGRECSLGARWVLISMCVRTPAPLRRANVARGPPLPAPPRAPPPEAPRWGRVVASLRSGVFMRGPALPRSPRAPLPLYVSVSVFVCSGVRWWWYPLFLFYSGRFGGGARGPSVVLRPARFGPHAGCRPMSPAPRLRSRLLCACGLGVRPRGHLAGRGPVRFKWPRARTPCPLAIA